jgi:nitroimidazol reductase NimA-like FMN-containing flavoprotein (pyridoxamine 5'-phosphate oxidase superfamily)
MSGTPALRREVFAYGRFECDTSIAYRSAIAFGRIAVVEDEAARVRFFDALMAKYQPEELQRPRGFYPRLGEVTVYVLRIERITGKETPLPPPQERWPAADRTRSPGAQR